MTKKSANTRLDFVRHNNQLAAAALLKDEQIESPIKKLPSKENAVLHKDVSCDSVCICNRKSQVVECKICKMIFYGRISEKCPQHPNVTFLLDFFYCPKCTGSKENLKKQYP